MSSLQGERLLLGGIVVNYIALFVCLYPLKGWSQTEAALTPFIGHTITRVQWQGNRTTRDFVIAREIHSRVGQPLRLETALDDIRRLNNLDIFSTGHWRKSISGEKSWA